MAMLLSAFWLSSGEASAQTPPAPAPAEQVIADPLHFVFFDTGSARVHGEAHAVLDRVVQAYRELGLVTVVITANADHVGSSAANLRLSRRRANAVAAQLARRGIPRNAVTLRPMGETRPLVMTPDGVAEAQNRYAVILLGPGTPASR